MGLLILLRHGESMWNKLNLFTGWVDVPLSDNGINEARNAGRKLIMPIDAIFTSTLIRAQQTAMIVMASHPEGKVPVIIHEENDLKTKSKIFSIKAEKNSIPVYIDWRLNERFYGDLQGNDKEAMREKYGAEQIKIWRRSFDIAPPGGESLAMTAERTLPCFKERIIPELENNKSIFVCAHGNSLRSIIMFIENLNKEAIIDLELPTGVPQIYQYQNKNFIRSD